jgi:hypothetical protein
MTYSIRDLDGFALAAIDGEIGHAKEAYFDDQYWTIRYVVADTGSWLTGRKVLISPHAIRGIDRTQRRIDVALERSRIESAPDIDTARPVSRQHEIALYNHYGWPYWWRGSSLWGATAYPLAEAVLAPPAPAAGVPLDAAVQVQAQHGAGDPHLRSSAEVIGYGVEARDGAIGHIHDLLFDPQSWTIRYAVVDTGHWLPGRQVLIAPQWLEHIDWAARRARVRATRAAVESSPPYRHGEPLHEDHFQRVQRHFERSE